MKVKNTSPLLFGAKVTSRRPPQPEMTLIVRGAFTLRLDGPPGEGVASATLDPREDQGVLRAEVFAEQDEERRGECLYPGDFADFKLNAEVMLRGTCHAPGGRPTAECSARFAVGAWSKSVRVVGRRFWSDDLPGAVMSEPAPFTRKPIGYEHAFGGPGYAPNPVGQGFAGRELPGVERLDAPIRRRADQPGPAGLGPHNPAWPQRASKVGKEYGRSYRERRAPYYAEDFDWTYFHAAPADQQLPGYLRGDEEVLFQNLHPAAGVLRARLPGWRVRAFVKDVRGRFREARLSLDTLFADLDEGTVYLTWRGVDPVAEDDLTDVATVLVTSEAMREEPLPAARCREMLEDFERDPLGFDATMPGLHDQMERGRQVGKGEGPAEGAAPDPLASALQLGLAGSGGGDRVQAQVQGALGRLKESGVDTASLLGGDDAAGGAPLLLPFKPGSLPSIRMRPLVRSLLEAVEQAKKSADASGQRVAGLEAIDAFVGDPRLQQLDPRYRPPRPDDPPPEEPGPGRDLSDQDLTGRDLSGLDLTGANLEGAILTRAILRDAVLRGASLKYAVLYQADLAGADLTGADLTLAQLAKARAAGADLSGALVEQASFEGADLRGARLRGAKGEYVELSRADLRQADVRGAALARSHFLEAIVEGADFTGANLSAAHFVDARARGAVLAEADLTRASFENADLGGAILAGARGDRSMWMRARLDGADLRGAWMPDAHFSEASAERASFQEANLKNARFYRASLGAAVFVRANLFAADLRKTTLTAADFSGANLYDAKLIGASGKGCVFEGANLKRSTLEAE